MMKIARLIAIALTIALIVPATAAAQGAAFDQYTEQPSEPGNGGGGNGGSGGSGSTGGSGSGDGSPSAFASPTGGSSSLSTTSPSTTSLLRGIDSGDSSTSESSGGGTPDRGGKESATTETGSTEGAFDISTPSDGALSSTIDVTAAAEDVDTGGISIGLGIFIALLLLGVVGYWIARKRSGSLLPWLR